MMAAADITETLVCARPDYVYGRSIFQSDAEDDDEPDEEAEPDDEAGDWTTRPALSP